MRRNVLIAVVLLVLLFGSECLAYRPAVIGGIRSGLALGLVWDRAYTKSPALRMGFEANTSNTPAIVFIGGKWFLNNIRGGYPMFISGGLVGYLGNTGTSNQDNNSTAGPYISLIFERLLDVAPLFLEVGIDVVSSGRLQFQVGYFF